MLLFYNLWNSYMSLTLRILFLFCLIGCSPTAMAQVSCEKASCCEDMGGISYCDSSAGRYVCNNGYFSSCYCTRHAVMDLQDVQGCCLYHGGVLPRISTYGIVMCRDGTIAELCSIQTVNQDTSRMR